MRHQIAQKRNGGTADESFRALTEPYRGELHVHCYRMLGSVVDAEDAVQETLLAAWRGLERFEGRASVRGWLYRIATNRCLNARRDAARRPRRALPVPPFEPPPPTRWDEIRWFEPYPDDLLGDVADGSPDPEARYEAREATELAFVAALQVLPGLQRAALILRDVLGYDAQEVAAMLVTTEVAVKGALQRARAALRERLPTREGDRPPPVGSEQERALARRFARAFAADDVAAVVAMLTADAWLTMPPYPHAYQGPDAIAAFLRASVAWRDGERYALVATRANRQPAFACYLRQPGSAAATPAGLIVLELVGEQVARVTRFMDPALFVRFGLPASLD